MSSSSSSILIINEIESEREEISRALDAEGFRVVQAASATAAVREIWEGSFIAAVIPTLLTGTSSAALTSQLSQMAPELETVVHGKNDDLQRLVRKLCEIRDGVAAA
jgi:DNA-binding NtrC family response regulator